MGFVVSHPALVLDEFAHPTRGPQSAGISERLGSRLERAARGRAMGRDQLGLDARARPALRRPRTPDCSKLPRPANNRLPVDAQTPRHLGLAKPLSQ